MQDYEIRLQKETNDPPKIHHLTQVSDFAAIRKARQMAAGERLEVWRNNDCIYTNIATPPDCGR